MTCFPFSICFILLAAAWCLHPTSAQAQQQPATGAAASPLAAKNAVAGQPPVRKPPAAPLAGPAEDTGPESEGTLPAIPPRPGSHVLDETGMLSAEVAKALSERLLASQTRTGLSIYVAIHTYLFDENADHRASRTHDAWMGTQGAGIVVVHDRSTGRISFAGTDDKRMPDGESLKGLFRLADASAKSLPAQASIPDRLIATLTGLAEGLESWQKNGRLPAPPPVPVNPPPAAGEASATNLLARPESLLLDQAGVFSETAAADLRAQLNLWRQQFGLHIYVLTLTYPPSGMGNALADKLALEWLPGEPGGVIIFDRSQPDSLTIGNSPFLHQWLPLAQLKETQKKITAAGAHAGEKPEDQIAATAAGLMKTYVPDDLPVWREGHHLLSPGRRKILFLVLAGSVILGTFLYLLKRWQEKTDRLRRTNFRFPEVFVPIRLGAPHGGGVAAESPPTLSTR